MPNLYLIPRILITCLLTFMLLSSRAQDTSYIKVHFLYGSKPLKAYKKTEPKWFGGILGGHAGIESNNDQVLNFIPDGKFHLIANKNTKHSKYIIDSVGKFYSRLGGQHPDSAKQAIIVIPVTRQQKLKFDSICARYLSTTPYDYAFLGMRCGAATYEILGQLGIMQQLPLSKTSMKIFYPKILRKQLLTKAEKNGWQVIRQDGTSRRKWESD